MLNAYWEYESYSTEDRLITRIQVTNLHLKVPPSKEFHRIYTNGIAYELGADAPHKELYRIKRCIRDHKYTKNKVFLITLFFERFFYEGDCEAFSFL